MVYCLVFCIFNNIFNAVLFTRYLNTDTVTHGHHIMPNLHSMSCVFGGYFLGICFLESIVLISLSVAKYFLGHSEIPNSADPCL